MAKIKYNGSVPKDDLMFSGGWALFGKDKLNNTSHVEANLQNSEINTTSSRLNIIDWSSFFGSYFTQVIVNSQMRSKLIEELGEEFPFDKYFDSLSEEEQFELCCACHEILKKYSTTSKEFLHPQGNSNGIAQLKELCGIFYIVFGENEYGLFESEQEAMNFMRKK